MTWRDELAPLVAKTIEENRGKPEKEIRAALRKAYPFSTPARGGPSWMYKVWLSEIRAQLPPKREPIQTLPMFKDGAP